MQHHYQGCGTCSHCSTGWQQLCDDGVKAVFGVTGHGAHAKYMRCPVSTIVPLRDDISFIAGAAISCGTGTAWGALERLDLKANQTIAIFGMGPVGLSAVMLARSMGAKIIALDTNKQRLDRSIEFGADIIINPEESTDLLTQIKDHTKGLGVNASIDASSSPSARSNAVKCVKTWGKACFVGEGGEVTLDVSNDLLRRQVTLIGSWTFSKYGQAECADFVAEKNLDVDQLFTHKWSLNQAVEAYELFDNQSDGKGVFIP
jgi:threonine dehydrogenase-like Zn-dependent dehydrogenase